jgi:hypothetical protein
VLSRIRRDVESGIATGEVRGTPTLFIDGLLHLGPYDAAGLVDALQGEHEPMSTRSEDRPPACDGTALAPPARERADSPEPITETRTIGQDPADYTYCALAGD